jgi:sulfonate transport system permease protein
MDTVVDQVYGRKSVRHGLLLRTLLSAVVPVTLLIAWELAVRWGFFPKALIASPTRVFTRFFEMLFGLELLKHATISLIRLLTGFVLGALLGILFGTVVGASRLGARLFEPSILSLIPIPPIAWIPLLIILFGIGDLSKILLISIGSFCTLFIHTAYGIRTADKNLVEVANVLGKSRLSTLWHILLPSAIPNILSSMRVAMALSWTLLIASEVIASSKGLGWLIWDSRNFSRPDDMIVGMVAVGILGKLTDTLLVRLERYLTRWRATYQDIPNV